MYLWQTDRNVIGYDEFVERWDRVIRTTATLMIENNLTEDAIGFVQLYDINLHDGWAHFTTHTEDRFRGRGHGAEATMHFLDYVFAYFNVRKIYAEVNGFNGHTLQRLIAHGFRQEGRLREHVYWNGQYWDFHNLALYRGDWLAAKRNTKLRLIVESDLESGRLIGGNE